MARRYTIHTIPEHLKTDQWREGKKLLVEMIINAWTKVGVPLPLGQTKEAEEARRLMLELGLKAVFRAPEVPTRKRRKKQPAE